MTTKYEILVLRSDGTNEFYPIESDMVPAPPETGDDWDLGDGVNTVRDLDSVARIEVGPPAACEQSHGPRYVWAMGFEGGGETQDWWCEGEANVPPHPPDSGRWWPLRGSRGDLAARNRKSCLYISLANMVSVSTWTAFPIECTPE